MDDEFGNGRYTFYYSREKRLEKASKAVRELNETSSYRKPGLFRTLTATQPLRFLFISIITICAMLFILTRFLNVEGVRVIGNNTVEVSIITARDNSYVTVKKTIKQPGILQKTGQEGAYAGVVDIAVSLSESGNSGGHSAEALVHVEQIYFGPEPEEVFRFSVPFRGKKIFVLMDAGVERILFTLTL
ncbi:MAG: hypothetical protein LBH07_08860 [Treponema sp.]|jgi:hypothetical protein|nr:hypothetical protein [Treponema sp.]